MNQNPADEISDRASRKKIPMPVILIACLYLAVGVGGFAAHFSDRTAPDWIWIEITETIAVVCGVFLLRGHNWARWLAGAWMAFHLAISFGEWGAFAVHGLFFALIVWCLFRPDSTRFFRHPPVAGS